MRVISLAMGITAMTLWGFVIFIDWVSSNDLYRIPLVLIGVILLILAFYIANRVRQKEKTIAKNKEDNHGCRGKTAAYVIFENRNNLHIL